MIYLDAAATTPVRQDVLDVIIPLLTSDYGNPSSTHSMGQTAKRALDYARRNRRNVLGVRTGDVVFTSGGTESNNLAIKGLALGNPRGRHLIHSAIEHPSVAEACAYLVRHHGFELDVAPVDAQGSWTSAAFTALLRPDTTLVSVMAVNNEVGTIQPDRRGCSGRPRGGRTGALRRGAGSRLAGHGTDRRARRCAEHLRAQDRRAQGGRAADGARQAGPGTAGPRRRSGTRTPLGHRKRGGGRGKRHRSVPGRAGKPGAAAQGHGAYLISSVLKGLNTDGRIRAKLTGDAEKRVPGIVSFVFPETGGETVLLELERRGVVCSSGSACAAGSTDASPCCWPWATPKNWRTPRCG